MHNLLVLIIPIVLILATWFVDKKLIKINSKIIKIIAILFVFLGVFRFLFSDAFVGVVSGNYLNGQLTTQFSLNFQSIIRWGYNISLIVLPIAVFFENKTFKNVGIFFALIFSVLTVVAYNDFILFFTQPATTNSISANQSIREALFSLEVALSIYIPLYLVLIEKHFINLKDKREVISFFVSIIFIALACMPTYLPQSLLGYSNYNSSPFSIFTILWFMFTILQVVAIYLVFRFKDHNTRLSVATFLALALMVQYSSVFLVEISFHRLPLQLCNLGAYAVLIAIIIRKQAFFNYVFIANLLGTILAMLVPSSRHGLLEFNSMHYLLVHMQLFVAVSSCLTLRIFSRPKKEAIKHYLIGFTIYFMVVLVAGTIINSYKGQGTVDYFYLFSTTIIGYFPFLISLKTEIVIGSVVLYPIYQLFIYAIFSVFAVVLYFATKKIYAFAEDYLFLRKLRIEMRIEKNKYKNKKIPPLKYVD